MTPFTRYQKFIVALLAFLQFSVILDFMILSPLGATLMPALHITPSQFGLVVSVYAFSAGSSGILAAGFADRFDRKKLLLFFYFGFVLGTLCCALSQTFTELLLSRMITGIFGGVIGSIVSAISTDLFPYEMRGRVMGFVQTAFAGSQILGIPLGLLLSNHFGWHAPFSMIVIIGTLIGFVIIRYLKPIDAHLKLNPDRKPFHHLWETISTPRYLQAFATVMLLGTGGFMLMPFGSAYSVHNLGLTLEQLPMIYLITGMSAMITGPLVGRAADRFGKFKVFLFGTVLSITMVLIYTNLGPTPLAGVVIVNSILFVGIFSRSIPAQALMSAIPEPSSRGAFMSISSSLQQISGGFAAILAGLIVSENPDGSLVHFNRIGYVVALSGATTLLLMYLIHVRIVEKNRGKNAEKNTPKKGPSSVAPSV